MKNQLRLAGENLNSEKIEKYIANILKMIEPFKGPFFVVLAIYFIAMIPLWRANFSYMDDMGRALTGLAWSHDFNRYSQSWLSYALNMSFRLSDISPIPQMVAMFFLAVSNVIVTYVFCDRKIKYVPLILSTFIGLTPFMLGCWVFKFDAPGMALSVLASVVPFLFFSQLDSIFTKRNLLFGFVSVLCLMIMWTSYQASSGIYLVLALGLALKEFLERVNVKEIIKKFVFFITIYAVSVFSYRIFFPNTNGDGYRQTKIFKLPELATGVFHNIQNVAKSLLASLNPEWTILLMLLVACFIVTLVIYSKRNKLMRITDAIVGIIFFTLSIPLSYGAYLVLEGAPTDGRSLVGIGVVIAIVAIITFNKPANILKAVFIIPSLVFLYSFIVFSWAFGNGLADQERYGNFRVEILMSDLSRIYITPEQVAATKMQIRGSISEGPVMQHVHSQYPVVGMIFNSEQTGLAEGAWGTKKVRMYYQRPQEYVGSWKAKGALWDCKNMKTELDTYYHTIKTNDVGNVCILIKETSVPVSKK